MSDIDGLCLRRAGPADAAAIAELHADSWRRNYRGAYSDGFLDGDVLADRTAVWTHLLREPDGRRCTMLADDGGLIGFASTVLDADPAWGSLLDNLHVAHGYQRRGIGSRLLGMSAGAVIERGEGSGLYLWVLEQNIGARAFYEARGGSCVDRATVTPPGGIADRLAGTPVKLRYAWPDPAVLAG